LPLASALVSGCGFSLHANTSVPAHRRDQLERLLRYTARGAVSLERLERDANGDVLYPAGRREQVADALNVGATVPRWPLCSRGLNPPASLQHCARCIATTSSKKEEKRMSAASRPQKGKGEWWSTGSSKSGAGSYGLAMGEQA
jgi:hypothetical protein